MSASLVTLVTLVTVVTVLAIASTELCELVLQKIFSNLDNFRHGAQPVREELTDGFLEDKHAHPIQRYPSLLHCNHCIHSKPAFTT